MEAKIHILTIENKEKSELLEKQAQILHSSLDNQVVLQSIKESILGKLL